MELTNRSIRGCRRNSADWWELKTLLYVKKNDSRDRPEEYRAQAALCIGNVVDFGCSFGSFASYLPEETHYIGLDIAPSAIALARLEHRTHKHIFRCADMMDLPKFEDWMIRYNICAATGCANQLLEHFSEIKAPMDVMASLVTRRLIITVPRGICTPSARDNDGHVQEWMDEEQLIADLEPWGTAKPFACASNHIGVYLDLGDGEDQDSLA